jgi:hypothetical protein
VPSIATTATPAASANFQVSARTSRERAMRSRSTGSSAAIGAATWKPAPRTAPSSASAEVAPGT